jgi:hypothetical protein
MQRVVHGVVAARVVLNVRKTAAPLKVATNVSKFEMHLNLDDVRTFQSHAHVELGLEGRRARGIR